MVGSDPACDIAVLKLAATDLPTASLGDSNRLKVGQLVVAIGSPLGLESTVLGLVGAGGIGLQLDSSISTLAWTQVSLILLTILATVLVSEWVSAKVRHAII